MLTHNKGKPELKDSDDEIVLRMLSYCADTPRPEAQLRAFTELDAGNFLDFVIHCIRRGLLKVVMTDDKQQFVTTERGKQVLSTAEDIMQTLGTTPEEDF